MGRKYNDEWERYELVRIGKLVRNGVLSYREIGKLYNVTASAIAGLVHRHNLTSDAPNYSGSPYTPSMRREAGRVARSRDDRWTEARLTKRWKKRK